MIESKIKPASFNKRQKKRPSRRQKSLNYSNSPKFRDPNHKETSSFSKTRLLMIWAFLVLSLCGLGWRLYQLQIIQAVELKQKATAQQFANLHPYIPRRAIIDSENNVLATDQVAYTLYVHPIQFTISPAEVAEKLTPILQQQSPTELVNHFSQKETGIRLVDGLTESQASKIKALKLDGLELNEYYSRFYPQESTASEIIGYLNQERYGQAGLEYSQDKLLKRPLSSYLVQRDGRGLIMPVSVPSELLKLDNLNLKLTLDLRLQRAAHTALNQQIKAYKAKRGAVVVMDVWDGSLLALATLPNFNPNEYSKYDVKLFKNWTVSDLYEPGSTFKPINVAIALDAGVIEPNSYINDPGSIRVDGWDIFNASKSGYGSMSIAQVLQNSSNVAMVKIMSKMKKAQYYEQLENIGLNQKVNIDLPGEVPGHLKSKEEFTSKNIEVATAAFGQGISLTPVKLVQLNAALANGGKLVTPHLVQGLVDWQDRFHWQPNLGTKQVFSPESSQAVLDMMETTVQKGSGKAAIIPGYRIGGKTGTAQKAGPRGGYLANAKITSFVAILPIEKPRYVVLGIIDEPQGGNTFGGTVAAPMVKKVMESLIAIKGIPPAKLNTN